MLDMYDTPDDLVLKISQEGTGVRCPLAGRAGHPIVVHCVRYLTCGEEMAWYLCTHCRQTWPVELDAPESGDFVLLEDIRHPYDDRRKLPYR